MPVTAVRQLNPENFTTRLSQVFFRIFPFGGAYFRPVKRLHRIDIQSRHNQAEFFARRPLCA
jgi:hypothetical protein